MLLQEAIDTLGRMPEALSKRVAGLSDAELRFAPSDQVFSALESVCHLRDIEAEGYGPRLARLLAEDRPQLPDLDGAALARERHYKQQEFRPALEAFLAARRLNLRVLAGLDSTELARRGQLENVGEITLGRLLELWTEHDSEHLRELDQVLEQLHRPKAHRPKPSLSLQR